MEYENAELCELARRRYRLEQEINEIEKRMGELQRACSHERDSWPDAWWCQKCGSEIKATGPR